MSIKKILGAKIKKIRKEMKFSQECLAELSGMNPRQIARIEAGESFPSSDNLEKIAKALGILPQELFLTYLHIPENELRQLTLDKINGLQCEKLRFIYSILVNI